MVLTVSYTHLDVYKRKELGRYGGSGHWEQDGTGVWYAYDNGGYPASCWKQINGAWYYSVSYTHLDVYKRQG